jgi:tetratricopeptide (TPR) repeat protein
MNRIQFLGIGVVVLNLSSFCFAESKISPKEDGKVAWTKKMKSLQDALQALSEDIYNDNAYKNSANFKRIEENTKKLSQFSHTLEDKDFAKNFPDMDPSIEIISGLFSEEAGRAVTALKNGQREYARTILKTISNYCFACHSRTNSGPEYAGDLKTNSKNMSQFEKAELLMATRRYDEALIAFKKLIADPNQAKMRQIDWEKAVRQAVAVAVRVKKSPDTAIDILDSVVSSEKTPQFLKADAKAWGSYLKVWKGEMPRTPTSEEGIYAEAQRVLKDIQKQQKFFFDRSTDIHYLRLSSLLHDLLRSAPKGKHVAEALYLLGVSYESLRDLDLWTMHEMLYEACVRKEPGSDIAKTCYTHYEQAVFSGYSGSGGFSLPAEATKKLADLKSLAFKTK